ncbi:hypothetical protein CPB84DRAFT_1837276 [Gymnopilus junonius]|uniref:Uncharacterized protein n=1 Tax=Gymnopilus junonius TaxID=109634 RepID=A0A9P5NKQ8_GYMJU|nr:hypothetical protein CPB84DRAFT_1837276 [Gymnopilus junonius]
MIVSIHFLLLQLIHFWLVLHSSTRQSSLQYSIVYHLFHMSQPGVPALNSAVDGLNCNNCGRFVQFQACKSNKNGNKGVLFTTATFANLPSLQAPLAPIPHAVVKCLVEGCGQSRIADDCQHRICRKHCVEKGGCLSKKHRTMTTQASAGATAPASSFQQAPPMLPPPASFPLHSEQPRSSTPLPTPPPAELSELPLPEVVDARPDPRLASHLRPIFTEALAQQHEFREQQRKLDSERQAHAKKAKERVAVYAWTSDDAPHRIFLKDQSLCKWIDVQRCLEAPSRNSTLHLRYGLPRERAYVREMLKAGSPLPSPQRTPSPPSPPGFSTPVLPQLINHKQMAAIPFMDLTASSSPSPSPSPSQIQPGASHAGAGSVDYPIEIGDGEAKRWPADYHVVDIARCLRECSGRTTLRRNRAHTQ